MMQLSADMFKEILAAANSSPPSRSGAPERRADPRIAVSFTAPVISLSGPDKGTACNTTIRDLSFGGMNILFRRQLLTGEKIVVQLSRGREKPALLIAEVKHCKQLTKSLFYAGCKFLGFYGDSGDLSVRQIENAIAETPAADPETDSSALVA
jgi:PilZ domain